MIKSTLGKAHMRSIAVSQKLPQRCLYNSSNVCLMDDGPLVLSNKMESITDPATRWPMSGMIQKAYDSSGFPAPGSLKEADFAKPCFVQEGWPFFNSSPIVSYIYWILTSRQPHRVTSGRSNSALGKCIFQNLYYMCKPYWSTQNQ